MTAEVLAEAASYAGSIVEERGASAALVHYGIEPAGAVKVAWAMTNGNEDQTATLLHGVIVGLAVARAMEGTNEAAS